MKKAVLLDIDGTLVDSNDAHAKAWMETFREAGIVTAFEDVRCAIGMGGDHLLPKIAGIEKDSPQGQQLSHRRGEVFRSRYLNQLQLFPKARELLQMIKEM